MTEPDPLRAVIEPVVAAAGFDLEEITVVPAGRRRLVRVVIDSDAGVDLDAAAEVSAALSVRLDEGVADEVFGEAAYTLEVTSPGIGRPLTLPRHFRRATGRIVSITHGRRDRRDWAGCGASTAMIWCCSGAPTVCGRARSHSQTSAGPSSRSSSPRSPPPSPRCSPRTPGSTRGRDS